MSPPPPPPTFFLPPVPRHQVPPLSSFYIFQPTCYSSLAGRSEFRNCPPSPSPSIIRGNHPPESPSILRGASQADGIIRGENRPKRPPLPRQLRGLQRLSIAVQVKNIGNFQITMRKWTQFDQLQFGDSRGSKRPVQSTQISLMPLYMTSYSCNRNRSCQYGGGGREKEERNLRL